MLVIEGLKLNVFKAVPIPRPIDLFQRLGYATPGPNSYSGDNFAPASRNKVDSLALMDELDRQYKYREDYASQHSSERGESAASAPQSSEGSPSPSPSE